MHIAPMGITHQYEIGREKYDGRDSYDDDGRNNNTNINGKEFHEESKIAKMLTSSDQIPT